jgi:serine/threonine-protein kinase RsbW
MVVPMGEDNELIAANTAEQIAKRLTFRPEAINQIKTAIVEACINASEHSFSPDRKIYQRFRVESDRLVITISSRGIVPANLNGANSGSEAKEAAEERRGWGLKLIRTLMDEVEFERVDDGTSLRMTKYLRSQKKHRRKRIDRLIRSVKSKQFSFSAFRGYIRGRRELSSGYTKWRASTLALCWHHRCCLR